MSRLVHQRGFALRAINYMSEPFESTNIQRAENEEFERLREALGRFYDHSGDGDE